MKKDQNSQVTRIPTGILEATMMKHMEIELNGWMCRGTSKSMKGCMAHWSALNTLRQQRYQQLKSEKYSLKKSQ